MKLSEPLPPTIAWSQLRYHKAQSELWLCKKRFVAVPAGRGSGKTELARRRLVRMLPVKKEWPDPRYFYGAPTLPQAKRIAWQVMLRLIPKSWIVDVNRSELVIETIFGSSLQVIGLDRPQRIEGVQWDGCVVDESCDIKPGTFDLSILPSLTWRDGWCWRIGVPKRFGIGAIEFRDFFEKAVRGDIEDAAGFTWASKEILPASALKFAQEHMDPKDYSEQFDATFLTSTGGVFYAFDEQYNIRPCPYRPDLPLVIGSDFNVNPMSWVIGQSPEEDRFEIIDELWIRDANTVMTLDVLYQKYQNHKAGFEFFGDATSKARKTSAASTDYVHIMSDERFKALGRTIHYARQNPPQADRFAATNALICNANKRRRLFIDPRCKRLIQDLRVRTYKPRTREPDDKGDIGHPTDALGYIIYRKFPIRIKVEGQPEIVISSPV